MNKNPLFWTPQPVTSPSLRLFCFPFAGGSAQTFTFLKANLDPSVEIVLIEYPGRGRNFQSPPSESMSQLVDSLLDNYRQLPAASSVFLGHSLGACVAWELMRNMRERGIVLPRLLIASGCSGAHLASNLTRIHDLPDEEFVQALKGLEGTPQEVLEHDELLALLKPMLRADFKIAEQYCAPAERMPVPILGLAGTQDELATPQRVQAWSELTDDFRIELIEGGHFFMNTHPEDVVTYVNQAISPLLCGTRSRETSEFSELYTSC
ncbi:alpha/beta fold hydrolase [Vibrio sp. 10N.261.46.E12]|uniref:thioesterase II family protein n=1 Tax=unclassified Vibrio TaxID=2614977 RepID=UPI000975A5CD|nr:MULTISPECIES: alpha/beta fold hydrolase [unclassified Vibrio]OMO35818.1 hypothetical protein BH584_06935 [Vibrio sp. 10N.261.45.E1]PMJ34951.1 hypothetical protein BCU27_24500 [Vibrio sp. 10N.286.45.B6]PML86973.1 hypothetical protein BCT66_13010 [Vibrio sp. 10N.261.49.E11]PMM69286.1 hypothetical protein BCT48_10910 [Vibrio sp. 10N.261.46.F12]PMM85750.1 hypothetical protein BCT46_08790 [Vibrio sp. 10N.261.46.E8]